LEDSGPPSDGAVSVELSEDFVARSTRRALRTGIFWTVAGGARTLLVRLLESIQFQPCVYATGGEASVFCGAIPELEEVLPNLVLEGLALSYRAGGQ
jgi:pantothenate kinase type III